MIELIAVLTVILTGIVLFATDRKLKKGDWNRQDSRDANNELLKKLCVDTDLNEAVIMKKK